MGSEEYDLHLKLLMLGDTGVGKTCLLLRYSNDMFKSMYITTIGIDYKSKFIEVDSMKLRLQIWDTAGQERFRTITVSYFKGAHGIMLVYDITDRETFDNISHWITQIKEHADSKVTIVLVGNKSDKGEERQVQEEEGRALAESYNVKFFETSAKDNLNVSEAYEQLARETKDKMLEKESQTTQSENIMVQAPTAPPGSKSKKCC
mmetsp:Transcript_23192/g.30287  ORF Transcript_23192/g.30287 Transcript_23192/m.30287 type:complete len:205 (+) Transcript_23192:193-807(+)